VVALFCILMMVAMMSMMMGGMSAFHGGPMDSRDMKRGDMNRDVREHDGES